MNFNISSWKINYPPKQFVVDGEICYGAVGYHSAILEKFIKLKIRRPINKKIKRLK